ncbi:type II toxin-antitoxin system RelE/ParE family toxin [Paenibacillus athensensis]|uniref:Addiction module toxin RelE n=1 Tax=Paenibacillus athensensis TaxID=1967502 RepID=A0A4Y8Q090_9BACL|nr:type II toxin-antitoxin system RelE/ParE family toxin [Paenibacillus athensensis]MCD1261130.1 type II toxin-antitoxin system RelE/ParE family toxin [Paenibacillus athensensis]
MLPQSKITYSPAAVDDFDEIFSYISANDISAADKQLQKLDHHLSKLAEFPEMGSVLSEDDYTLVQRGYRFIVVSPYLIFYRIIRSNVIIHRILHGRRDYLRELFGSYD